MKKIKFYRHMAIVVLILLIHPNINITVADQEMDQEVKGDNYVQLYSQFHNSLLTNIGVSEYINDPVLSILNALDQAFAMITFIQLFDVFEDDAFLDRAQLLADIVYTNFQDPRFDLIANYYNSESNILSNYRNAIDNFLIAWALDDLVDRVDQTDLLIIRDYNIRASKIANLLENFVNNDFFVESYRVDNPLLTSKFNVYVNLMLSYIILESDSELFEPFNEITIKIFDLIYSEVSSSDGGVYSLYLEGFHDDTISLRNTALFSTLGFELYTRSQNITYLKAAEQSLKFIKDNFADLGVTRGYFETISGGKLVQLSKSLFSHSLLLLTFLKSANLGDQDSKLDLRSMWEMINTYFRSQSNNELFYSTIDRSGRPASQQSRSLDSLLMIFTLSRLSTIGKVEFQSSVDFRDSAIFRVSHIIPNNVTSTISLKFDEEVVKSINVTGNGKLTTTDIKIGLSRPKSDEKTQSFSVELSTLNLAFDFTSGSFIIKAKVGIELSTSAITLFSAVLIIFLVLLVNELSKTKIKVSN